MDDYSQFKKRIRHRAEILEETIRELESAGLAEGPAAERWRAYLDGIGESLHDPLLKIAVAGSVKSGKSTLINSLIGADLLKRGAGIVTAFITRVITSEGPGGWVELKSWRQINREINAGLRMLPIFAQEEDAREDLDIRRPEDRERIAFWLGRMKSEWLQSRGNIDPHFMFLERCLQGYPLIADEIGDEIGRSVFDAGTLPRHQFYVGDESRSVWVRDVELHYPVPWLGEHIELADLQGSDSPNPAHFELLQKYLLESRFIIYVISSRTGLREADFKLLDLLKALRVFPQTLFVLNLDLDVHGDRDDLDKIYERVRSELAWVAPDPQLFAFSALYRLLRQIGDRSSKHDRHHLKFWKESKAISKATETGFASFKSELEERILARKSQVLLGFGLSRLEMVAANVLDSARIGQAVLERSADGIREAGEQLRTRHIALQSTLENLADTVSGLNQSLKREVGAKIDACFDSARGRIVRESLDMVEHFPAGLACGREISDHAALVREYYGFYLEFRRDLIRRLTERVNLRIMEFAKDEELALRERIRESSRALWAFFDAALADYRRDLLGPDTQPGDAPARYPAGEPDFSGVPLPPPFSSFLERGSLARGIFFLKFGLSSVAGVLSQIMAKMRKTALPGLEDKSVDELFEKAVRHARDEARSELRRAFADFRENLKSGYLYRIVDEGCIFLLREFKARAEMAHVDFSNLLRQSELKGEQKVAAVEALTRARQITSAMIEELEDLRRDVRAGAPGPAEEATREEGALPE
ncbi:MAG: dynamin family protein [Syntrophobacteraceae bacterium]